MRIGRIVVALATMLLVAGCTRVVDGTVRPTPGMTPRPITGRTVERVLLGERELSKLLDQSLESDPQFPPRVGANGEVFDERAGASPSQCALVAGPMDKSSYQSADVRDGAREVWWGSQTDRDESVISVDEGVVALPTAAAAAALFQQVSEQWKHCDGVNVRYREDTYTLTGVGVADSVLSANARLSATSSTIPEARVVGVRVNCLVEVEVSYHSSYGRTPDERKSDAIAIAHRMMDNVSDLS